MVIRVIRRESKQWRGQFMAKSGCASKERGRQCTEDELLGGREHVESERDLILVILQTQPADERGDHRGRLFLRHLAQADPRTSWDKGGLVRKAARYRTQSNLVGNVERRAS